MASFPISYSRLQWCVHDFALALFRNFWTNTSLPINTSSLSSFASRATRERGREDGRRKSEKFNQPFRLLPTFVLKCRKPIFCRYCYAASHISHVVVIVVVNPDKLLFTVVVVLTRTQWIHVNSGPFKRR